MACLLSRVRGLGLWQGYGLFAGGFLESLQYISLLVAKAPTVKRVPGEVSPVLGPLSSHITALSGRKTLSVQSGQVFRIFYANDVGAIYSPGLRSDLYNSEFTIRSCMVRFLFVALLVLLQIYRSHTESLYQVNKWGPVSSADCSC